MLDIDVNKSQNDLCLGPVRLLWCFVTRGKIERRGGAADRVKGKMILKFSVRG